MGNINKSLTLGLDQTASDSYTITSSLSNIYFTQDQVLGFRMEFSSSYGEFIGITGSFSPSLDSNLIINTSDASVISSSLFVGFYDEGTYATGSNSDEIFFSENLSRYYGQEYLQDTSGEYQTGGAELTKYSTYGDIDENFYIEKYDLLVIKTSTISLEYLITDVSLTDDQNRIGFRVDKPLYQPGNGTFFGEIEEFIILKRNKDESNVILSFKKPTGKTSYGFLIPQYINPAVMKQINIITKEINQKLIDTQQSST